MADPTQMHQVVLNLCVNARDAMPKGGTLSITAENVVLDAPHAVMAKDGKPSPHVVIVVRDTGTGIPAEIREKIFDPFFTTKELGQGTGLGLSTTLAIVKSHGGFINLYSEPGKGTVFKIYLPSLAPFESEGPRSRGKCNSRAATANSSCSWMTKLRCEPLPGRPCRPLVIACFP